MKILLFLLLAFFGLTARAHQDYLPASAAPVPTPTDTSRVVDVEEVVVIATPKENTRLRKTETSVTLFSKDALQNMGVNGLSDLSGFASNFFMPDYGSAQTSAIYIRGVGSRINTPAVSVYIDDVPAVDKSGYNLHLLGINRIDVLRGPQGTLYGRNAMGGIIRIYTDNPFTRQYTEVTTGASTRDGGAQLSALTNQKFSSKLALSAGGFYRHSGGIYRNDFLGKKVGGEEQAGGRLRLMFKPDRQWLLTLSGNYEYTDQDTYPYFYAGPVAGPETLPEALDRITANRPSSYRRHLFSTAFKAEVKKPDFSAFSMTSYQRLDDRMMMDQDFISLDYYTLEQRQQSDALTQEFVVKSAPGRRLEWTGGLFGLWQNLRTQAPVVFYSDGVEMVNGLLSRVLPDVSYTHPMTGRPITISQSLALTDPMLTLQNRMRTPVLNGAAFVQATLHDLLLPRLSLTAGARVDYEHQELNFATDRHDVNFTYSMPMIQPAALTSCPDLKGKVTNDYTRLLPKLALKYDLRGDRGNLYLTLSQGHRSGGYNVQMFSDVMRTALQQDMMTTTAAYCNNLLQAQADRAPSEAMRQMFLGIKQAMNEGMPRTTPPDVGATVTYRPEFCWNYEAGTHLNFLDRTLTADLSLFFVDTHDQQIARFTDSGMGRIMVNAGRSHSCGIETALRGNFLDSRLTMALNYGFTHAVFHDYDAGGGEDYTDNYVPFIPMHNVGLMADYTLPLGRSLLKALTLGANANGFGRTYWTEANNAYQNFYATLGAHLLLDFDRVKLNLWGKNLTQTHYRAFYFESMNRGYYQKGLPLQLGFNLSLRL